MRIASGHPLLQKIDRFLYSPAFFLLLGVLTVLSNVFGLEFFSYTCFILIACYICLLGRDLLPLMPMFACGYISPSAANNPGFNDKSIFSLSGGGIYIAVLVAAVSACLIYRLVTDPDFGGKKFLARKRKLLPGMCILGISYAISGLGSGQWEICGWRNLLFAFLQFVAIAGLYYLLSGSVKWEQAPKAYLSWTGICVGYVLLAELLSIYITKEVFVDGAIVRDCITTGWGHYNSMGALFTLLIPLPFYLTGKGRFAWFAYVTAFVFWIGLLLTCSRGSIVVGTVIFGAGYILSLVHSHHARAQIGVHLVAILLPVLLAIFFRKELEQLFGQVSNIGFASFAQRNEGYMAGIRQFLKYPVFGGTFFPVDFDLYVWAPLESFTRFFPPRWHNTVIQLLATGGVTCLAAYGYHRFQTLKLFLKRPLGGKLFAGLSVLALLLTSLVDCHFFNVGPVLLYSATLAFVEFRLDGTDKKA